MGKTLFAKIFTTTIAIILISSVMTTALVFTQLGTYITKSQSEELSRLAEHVADFSEQIIFDSNETSWLMFQKYIDSQSRNEGCSIVIFDSRQELVAYSSGGGGAENGKNGAYEKIDSKYIEKALNGEKVNEAVSHKKAQGYISDSMLSMEPIEVEINGDSSVWGAVAVSRPMPQVRQARDGLMSMFFVSQIVALILAFLFSFVLSRRIARPISKLNSAAKAVAGGDFTKKVCYDSTDELGELISSFNHMTDALKEIDDTRSSFVSNVSHELRTPMTIISGFVEGIIDGTIAKEDQGKYLGIVLSETQRLSRLVTDLLETSRLESGKTKLVMKPFDINELIRKGIISYEQAITDKNIDVEAEFMYDKSYVNGAEDSIYRVIMNLMDNAIKFSPEGGVIRIKSVVKDQKVEVSIENSGDGISENDLSHIWERFYKTDKSRSMDKKGVGLGLYLVKTIINQHNNRIWAESKEGEYTRFTFTLDKVNMKSSQKDKK